MTFLVYWYGIGSIPVGIHCARNWREIERITNGHQIVLILAALLAWTVWPFTVLALLMDIFGIDE